MNHTLRHVIAALAALNMPSRAVGSRVEFDHRAYVFSHGKRPGGFGSWAFEPQGTSVPLPKLLEVVEAVNAQPGLVGRMRVDPTRTGWLLWMPAGTYGEAKTAAARLLAALGTGRYEVCT